jgi:tetratricopeptide (TPR) repeat protein
MEPYWNGAGLWREVLPSFTAALEAGEPLPADVEARALECLARGARLFDLAAAREYATRAVTMYRERGLAKDEARAVTALMNVDAADRLAGRARELLRTLGDRAGLSALRGEIVTMRLYAGDYEAAVRLADELLQDSDVESGLTVSVRGLKAVALKHLDLGEEARAVALETARTAWTLDADAGRNWWGVAVLAEICAYLHETATAATLLRWILDVVVDTSISGLTDTLHYVGQLAAAAGRLDAATELFGASDTTRQRSGFGTPRGLAVEWERDVLANRAALGAEAFHAAWQRGAALAPGEAAMRAHTILDDVAPTSRRFSDDVIFTMLA